MIFYDNTGKEIKYSRSKKILRYEEFTDPTPNWVTITSSSRSINSDESLVLTKGSNPNIIVSSRAISAAKMDFLRLTLENFRQPAYQNIIWRVTDGVNTIDITKVPGDGSKIGIYQNGNPLKVPIRNNGRETSFSYYAINNRPKNWGIHFEPMEGYVAFIENGYVIGGVMADLTGWDMSTIRLQLINEDTQIVTSCVELIIAKSR